MSAPTIPTVATFLADGAALTTPDHMEIPFQRTDTVASVSSDRHPNPSSGRTGANISARMPLQVSPNLPFRLDEMEVGKVNGSPRARRRAFKERLYAEGLLRSLPSRIAGKGASDAELASWSALLGGGRSVTELIREDRGAL